MYNLEERKKLFEMPEQLQRYRILIVIVDKKLVIFLEFRRDNSTRTTDSKNNQDWMKRWFCKTKTIIIFRRNNRVILTIEIVINKKGEMQNKLLQKCFHYLSLSQAVILDAYSSRKSTHSTWSAFRMEWLYSSDANFHPLIIVTYN